MNVNHIVCLSDYNLEINRCRLRYCGIGPRLANNNDKIWPRDCIRAQDECRKVLYSDIRKLINDEQKLKKLEFIISDLANSLQKCNLNSLFNRFCRMDQVFLNTPFTLESRLNAHTDYNKIYAFIHQIFRSIHIRGQQKNSLIFLFGSNRNFKIYKRHLKILVSGNAKLKRILIGRFVRFGPLVMNLDDIEWLQGCPQEAKNRVMIQVILVLTKYVAELLRRYFYILVSNPYIDKIFYFRYDLWQRMRDEAIGIYINRNLLQPVMIDESAGPVITSKMRFLLKKDGIRLICTKQGNSKLSEIEFQLHAVLLYILEKMSNNYKFTLNRFLIELKEMRQLLLSTEQESRRIYFVRADMEDCFHSIKQEKLLKVMKQLLSTYFASSQIRVFKFGCTLRRPRKGQREMARWSCSSESLMSAGCYESVNVISSKVITLDEFERVYIRPQILQPILRVSKSSKTGFRLLKGIRQGSKSSPLFCSIYIQQALNEHMNHHLLATKDDKLFRYVDDLLYMTTDLDKAREFVSKMLTGFNEFGLRSNASKLACNFECPNNSDVRQLEHHVVFFKRKICTETLKCSHVCAYGSINIDNTFYANPYAEWNEIRDYILKLIRIDLIHVDLDLNGRELVIENLFQHSLLLAFRVATLFIISFIFNDVKNQQPKPLKGLVLSVAERLFASITSGVKRGRISNNLNFREVHLIISGAFLASWQVSKLRHRTKEREALRKHFNRFKMRYLTTVEDEDQIDFRGIKLERKLDQLIRDFPSSPAWKEVRLPSKY